MEESAAVLELTNIGKAFSGVTVLHDVSMTVKPGEVHCIVGENGAGKSTLIKIISGAYRLDQGHIIYREIDNGQVVRSWMIEKGMIWSADSATQEGDGGKSPAEAGHKIGHELTPAWARENGINAIYQEIDLVPSLNAAENIFLGNEITGRWGNIRWSVARQQAQALLETISADIDVKVPVSNLKIAHQQMVAIAKALSLKSRIIIFDEPSAVFGSSEVNILFDTIRKLKAQGIAILYISHHLDEIFEIGDRVTVLRDGELIVTGDVGDFDKNSLARAMVGRDIDFSQRNGQVAAGQAVFRVEGLVRHGIVDKIGFTLHAGEVVGVAGLVGAGRTEMARMLVGADSFDEGQIRLNGQAVKIKSPKQALGLGIGMLPESRKEEGLVQVRSVGENLAYSMVQASERIGIVSWKRVKGRVKQLVNELEIRPPNPNIQVRFLSGGNQQKIVLGKLLGARSDVLILDEPTRGVDVGARAEIYKLMQRLKQDGKAILMISSDMTEILTQSDRILVMADGRIVGELSGREATEEQVISLALQLGDKADESK